MSWIANVSGGARHLTGPPQARLRVPGRPRAAVWATLRRSQRDAFTGASSVTLPVGRAGRHLLRSAQARLAWDEPFAALAFAAVAPRSLKHDRQTHSGSRTTAATARDGLVLVGSPFPARAWRPAVARGGAAVLVPRRRGRPARRAVLRR